jgi:hypothetical protein
MQPNRPFTSLNDRSAFSPGNPSSAKGNKKTKEAEHEQAETQGLIQNKTPGRPYVMG